MAASTQADVGTSAVALGVAEAEALMGITRWMDLARRFPLRPIRTEADYNRAAAIVFELIEADRDDQAEDYLEVLSTLVADYEDAHHEIRQATPGEILAALIDARGVTQAEVAAAVGISEPNLSSMLAGRRAIGKASRAKLAGYFGVKPARFVVD